MENSLLPLIPPKRYDIIVKNKKASEAFPYKKYNIIYADPPWFYRQNTVRGAAENHYPTMSMEDINNLPIGKIADKNCALFLWVTLPSLEEFFVSGIMTKWGFEYKTVGFVWVKRCKNRDNFFWGLGNYTRANIELCLLGIKGKMLKQSSSVHQIIYSPIETHSKKPDIVRDNIVRLYGDLPRIELFARQQTLDWDSWGNDV